MAISYVGSASGISSISLAVSQAVGDLIIVVAQGNGVLPGTPSGFTSLSTADDGTYIRSRVSYKIAASGDVPTCSISSASTSDILAVVYRGTAASPFGSTTSQVNSSPTSIIYPALTLSVTDGSSWIVGFAMSWKSSSSPVISVETPPTGMTNRLYRAWDNGSNYLRLAGHDTAGGVSSWSQQSVSISSAKNGAVVLELKDVPSSSFSSVGTGALSASGGWILPGQLASSASSTASAAMARVMPAATAATGIGTPVSVGSTISARDVNSTGMASANWDGHAVTRPVADLSATGQALTAWTAAPVRYGVLAAAGGGVTDWSASPVRSANLSSVAAGSLTAGWRAHAGADLSGAGTATMAFIGVGDSYFAMGAQGALVATGSATAQADMASSPAGSMAFAAALVKSAEATASGTASADPAAQPRATARWQATAGGALDASPAQALTTTPAIVASAGGAFSPVPLRTADVLMPGYSSITPRAVTVSVAGMTADGGAGASMSGYGAFPGTWNVAGSAALTGHSGYWIRAATAAYRPADQRTAVRPADDRQVADPAIQPSVSHPSESRQAAHS